jgi:hypothetical protein
VKHVSTWNLILGGWLVVVPLIVGGELFSQAQVTNDAVAGLLVLGCTAMVIFDLPRPLTWNCGTCAAGLWLLASRSVLSYGDPAAGNSATVGVLILVVSGLEVWRLAHTDSR